MALNKVDYKKIDIILLIVFPALAVLISPWFKMKFSPPLLYER